MFNFADAYKQVADSLDDGVLPEGEYEVTVKRAKHKVTAGGKQAFVVTLEVLNGPQKGRAFPEQLTWSPESEVAVRMFNGAMSLMGATSDWIQSTNPSEQQIADRITGSRIKVRTKHDEFPPGSGEIRNRVRFLGRVEGAAASPEAAAPTLGAAAPAAAAVPEQAVESPWS